MAELSLFVLGIFHYFGELLARAEKSIREALPFDVGHQAGEDGVEGAEDGESGARGGLVGGEPSNGRGGEDLNDVDEIDEEAADSEPVAGGLLLVDRAAVVPPDRGSRVVEKFPDRLAFGAAEELVVEAGAGRAAFGFEGVGAEGGRLGGAETRAEDMCMGADAD